MADGVATGKDYRWVLTTLRAMIPCAIYEVCPRSVCACDVYDREPASAVIHWFLRD